MRGFKSLVLAVSCQGWFGEMKKKRKSSKKYISWVTVVGFFSSFNHVFLPNKSLIKFHTKATFKMTQSRALWSYIYAYCIYVCRLVSILINKIHRCRAQYHIATTWATKTNRLSVVASTAVTTGPSLCKTRILKILQDHHCSVDDVKW